MSDALQVAEQLAERFAERAAGYDARASFPAEDMEDLRASGLLGLMAPVALGGMGAGFEDYARVAMALARGNGSTALLFNMHASVTGALAGIPEDMATALGVPPAFFATRDRLLRRAVEGAMLGVAITEPEAGSRLSALTTTYEPEDDGFRIRGYKSVCSGAGHLDGYLLAARAEGSPTDAPRVSYFLVEGNDGLTVDPTWDPLGMRATASNGLRVDVHAPREALVGGVEGLVLLLANLMPQWLVASYAAVYAGVARAAVDEASRYLGSRPVAGERGGLARLPAVQARLGRADAAAEAASLAVLRAARLVDAEPGSPETNRWVYRAKLLAGDAAMEVASSMAEACGLGALRRGSPLERILRDARSGALMPPSSDVAARHLGASALGLDPASEASPW